MYRDRMRAVVHGAAALGVVSLVEYERSGTSHCRVAFGDHGRRGTALLRLVHGVIDVDESIDDRRPVMSVRSASSLRFVAPCSI